MQMLIRYKCYVIQRNLLVHVPRDGNDTFETEQSFPLHRTQSVCPKLSYQDGSPLQSVQWCHVLQKLRQQMLKTVRVRTAVLSREVRAEVPRMVG